MTDTSSRSRVRAGVPTGGEFAAEQRAENADLEATQETRHPVGVTLTAAFRALGDHPNTPKNNWAYMRPFTKFALHDGSVYATDGYMLTRISSEVADGCTDFGVDAIEGKKLAQREGRTGKGKDGVLRIGGSPVENDGAWPIDSLRKIIDAFEADPDSTETRDIAAELRQLRSTPDGQNVPLGTGTYDPKLLERAFRSAKDLGAKQVEIQTRVQGTRQQVRITAPGIEMIVMSRKPPKDV